MKHLKLFFALFAMLALCVSNAWAETATITFKNQSSGTSDGSSAYTISDFVSSGIASSDAAFGTITCSATSKCYSGKTGMGLKAGGSSAAGSFTITFSTPLVNVSKVTLNAAAYRSDKPVDITVKNGSTQLSKITSITNTTLYDIDIADLNIASFNTLTIESTKYCYIKSITITYNPSAGGETPEPTTYTIKWHTAKGVTTDVTLNEGATITKPATDPTMSGYVFMGWTEDCEVASDGAGFTAIENFGTATEDKAYYAVFAEATTTGGGGGSTTGSKTLVSSSSSSYYQSGYITGVTGSNSASWTADAFTMVQNKNSGTAVSLTYAEIRVYANHSIVFTPTSGSTITSIVATATTNAYASALGGSSIANCTNSVSGSTVTITPTNGTEAITITNSAQSRLKTIVVNYTTSGGGTTTYDNYITTCSGSGEPVASVTLTPDVKDFGTVNVGETPSQEFTITTENTTAALTASIDNTTNYAVSAITGDKVTVTYQPQSAGTHSAVLTVKAGEEATATVNLTGKAVQALEGTWILVTDASSLKAGDEIIIASKDENYALSTTQNNNNRGQVEITKTDNTITATTEAQVLTLQAGTQDGTWALSTGDGYLYAASSSSNYLRTETNLSDNSSWIISIADGAATLTAQGSYTHKVMQYNQSSSIFACYESASQKPIALYKNTNGQQLAGLAYATTKYLTKLGDAFATPALTNPNSLAVTYSSSDNNVATVAADGAVTIKAAGIVTITASFEGNTSFLDGSAKYTICVTEHAGTQADPYSVADARRVIDVMETAEGVYATGIVSEIITAYNSTYGNISYNISADGLTTSDQLQAYRGKSYDGANFTSVDDVKVGDEVVIKGTLKKYSTTYEFDENNQLVSLNRTKQQAGLAYEEKEHTANVGEDFTEPTLTNPNSLTVTYSSSNTALATVDATTGEVSILAAGKVTITASSAADATYAAGSASYNITISDPSLAVAQLPFTYNSGKADIETTAGITQEGLGSDYTSAGSPKLKFDHTGDNIVICFGSQADELSYDIKGNPSQGTFSCTFAVQESEDGSTYTDLVTYTTLETTTTNKTHKLAPASRYVKFVFTEKSNGNVALGNISITKPDLRAEAGIAWDPATVSLTVGDAFTAPTFSNPNSLTVSFKSDNTALATVSSTGVISLNAGVTGKAVITASFEGNSTYKDATVTCTITVSPKSEKVVILAQYNGQWYALQAAYFSTYTNRLAALPVNYVGGKLYNVEEADKATIEWQLAISATKATFKNGENYLTGTNGTDLKLGTATFEWDYNGELFLTDGDSRTFIYHKDGYFRNYATSNAIPNSTTYSNKPVVTAPVYATGDAYSRSTTAGKLGTICLPFGSTNYTGATFYEFVGSETGKVYLGSVTTLGAGVPYIFEASAAEVAVYGDGTTAATPGSKNGLVGTFTNDTEVAVGNYILKDNKLCIAEGVCYVNANRAYIVLGDVPGGAPQQMPGRRYIGMDVQGENVETGVEDIFSTDAPAKLIENGQLIIIRDGVKYNVQGQKL